MLSVEGIDLYYGAAQALRGVSLTAQPGAVTTVLGRNGVGKTSLLRAIVGQQPVRKGAIRLDGREIQGLAPYDRARAGIAFVPQGREIFPLLTVKENLETGFAPLKRRDRHVPAEIYDLFPVLKDMLHRRGGDLSGGQQQQLAIGRALVTRPKLLVLDEPTEGIQPSIHQGHRPGDHLPARQGRDGDRAGRAVFRVGARPLRHLRGDGARSGRAVGSAGGDGRGGRAEVDVGLEHLW